MVRTPVWSLSRSRSLAGCPRAHLLRYHPYRIAGLEDAPALARLASPEALAGEAVDYAARKLALRLSRGGSLPSDARIVEVGLARYDERLSWREHHTSNLVEGVEIPTEVELTALQHEYYGHEPKRGRGIEDLRVRVEERLRCLSHSGALARLARLPRESLVLPKPGMPERRRLFGRAVYARPDLVVRAGSSTVVLDWKAGEDRPDARADAAKQLATYAAVEAEESACPLERVRVQAAFLASAPEWEPERVDRGDVEALRERIAKDLRKEGELCERVEACRRGALDWQEAALPRAWAGLCARCPFLEMCPEGRLASSKLRLRQGRPGESLAVPG